MYFDSQGKKVFYEVLGNENRGTPILLVHGWGGSSQSLRRLGELLAVKYRIILLDLPGFGLSDRPEASWGLVEYARAIENLLKASKLSKVIYFGHSFGGSLGIYLATHTSYIQALILCNSSYRRNPRKSKLVMAIKSFMPHNNMLRLLFYRLFFRNSDLARYPHLEPNFRNIVTDDSIQEFVSRIHVPTYIIWGQDDTITPVAWAEELHSKISKSQLTIVAGAKHGLPLRAPEVVAEHIMNFLNS